MPILCPHVPDHFDDDDHLYKPRLSREPPIDRSFRPGQQAGFFVFQSCTMNTPPKCLRCQTPMEKGFQTDQTYGAVLRTKWIEGSPEPLKTLGWNMGVKPAEGAEVLPITLFRCPTCGYLESYANPAPPSKK